MAAPSDVRQITARISQSGRSRIEKWSLPLDRARRFARDVVDDAVDAFDFVADAVGNAGEQFVGKAHPIGRHAVLALDDPQSNRIFVGALVAHDADRLHRKQNGE